MLCRALAVVGGANETCWVGRRPARDAAHGRDDRWAVVDQSVDMWYVHENTLIQMIDIAELPVTFSASEARRAGLHPRDLRSMLDRGDVVRLSRGLYRRASAPEPTHPDLLVVSRRAPAAVVCLVSALVQWDLTDELPPAVQIAIRRGARPPHFDHPPIEVFHFDAATFEQGIQLVEAAPSEFVRVYGPSRTVVDLMRFRHELGTNLALSSLRAYLNRGDARPADVVRYARALRVEGPVVQAMDAVLS